MVSGHYIPERGDIIWLQFDPHAGREQSGRRPALVISPLTYNEKVGLVLVCPITSRIKGYPFEVELPDDLGIVGTILSDHIKSFDWKVRGATYICKASERTFREVVRKLSALIFE